MIENSLISKRPAVAMLTDGSVQMVGEVVAYLDGPSYILSVDGKEKAWLAKLVREPTVDEAVSYWRDRALKAEQKESPDAGS